MTEQDTIWMNGEAHTEITGEAKAAANISLEGHAHEEITGSATAEILYHAYELGDIDNIFYPGKWNKMSSTIKKELENIELEDLGTIKENAYGIILNRIHREIDRDFIFSMLEENEKKNILPELTTLHFMIAEKHFTVLKDGKKISAALYATPQKLNKLTEPLAYEMEKYKSQKSTEPNKPEYYDLQYLAWKIAIYNPFFYALKSSPEFINTDIRTICLIIEQYLNETFGINQEIIERSQAYNNIRNWQDLFPRTKKDLDPLFRFARDRIGQKRFLKVPQNKITNTLISSLVDKPTAGQLDFLNAFEMEVSKGLTLKFEDVKLDKANQDAKPISVKTANGMKTLVILLREYSQHKNDKGNVRIPLSDIQMLRGYEDERTARRQMLSGMLELSKIGFEVKDNKKFSGYRRLNGGDHYIKNGYANWNWNPNFLPIIDDMKITDFPLEGLATDDKENPNAFYLTVFLSNSYRMNEGKTREGKHSVLSLIDNCPDLKGKFEKGIKIKERVMIPLIRDLDSLEWLNYTWHAATGEEIEDIYSVPSKDFLKCYIMVDYSEFPKHERRLKSKERKTNQSEKALINARAKLKAKEEQQKNTP